MLNKIFLAILQAATEFLPISSSGHLALFSNLFSEPDTYFFTALHLASLIAVIIFTRNEIIQLIGFNKAYRKMWLYLIVATLPAAIFGFLFEGLIEDTFSSLVLVGISFLFTGAILFLTRFAGTRSNLNIKNSVIIGLAQMLALFPGVSRSGITISSALFLGMDREKSAKFSFLLFIPLSLGAFILESKKRFYFDISLLISFIICLLLSLFFLKLLVKTLKDGKFWAFSVYCFLIGCLSLAIGICR